MKGWTKKLPKTPGLYWCFTGHYCISENVACIAEIYQVNGELGVKILGYEYLLFWLKDIRKVLPYYRFGSKISVPSVKQLDKKLKYNNSGGLGEGVNRFLIR